MLKEYKTILNPAVAEFEEKKSRFIATVKPAASEEEAVLFINDLKTKYWNATHNVYAYYINNEIMTQRFSDDGEPSGTAGMPVLEVIKRKELQDLAVVVTRYFGGTLLGASGLIRAYGRSAALGIEAAIVVKKQLCTQVSVTVEYTLLGKVQNLINSRGYILKDMVYSQDVELLLYIMLDEVEQFNKQITEVSNARAIIKYGKKQYITLSEEGKVIK